MRFLILTTSHGTNNQDQLMTNELVGALQDSGHKVDVILLKWKQDSLDSNKILQGPLNEDLLIVSPFVLSKVPLIIQRILKWACSPFKAAAAYVKFFGDRRYDAIIAGTPAILFGPTLRKISKYSTGRKPKKILFIHDFFPIHHAEIGLIPSRLVSALKRAEEKIIAKFDIVYCNLPSNIDFLKKNYQLSKGQIISWMPLWTRVNSLRHHSKKSVRNLFELPLDRPIAIFGGQLIEGRGIEDMLSAAELAVEQNSNLLFLFVGSGRLSGRIDDVAARTNSNVKRIASIPRDEYLTLVSACDVGMVATVPGVSSHSFPTKSMDYLRAGIPMAIALEPGSSLAAMLTDAGVAKSVAFGDVDGYLQSLKMAADDCAYRNSAAEAAKSFLKDVLDVRLVPDRIVSDMRKVTSKDNGVK